MSRPSESNNERFRRNLAEIKAFVLEKHTGKDHGESYLGHCEWMDVLDELEYRFSEESQVRA